MSGQLGKTGGPMAGLSAYRPSEVVLAARVARQFYLEGVSKVDIADQLGISRFRVARLLDSARESGLVRIEIGLPGASVGWFKLFACSRIDSIECCFFAMYCICAYQ